MTINELFQNLGPPVLVGWLLLLVAPRWTWTSRLILSGAWSLALSLVYLVLIARYMPGSNGGFGSLQEIRTLFSSDALLLAGWIHYLAFDLLIGAIEVRQANALGISQWLMIPVLLLTFLLGPIGLLAFFLLKSLHTRKAVSVLS
jgi:hypothetical protein